MKKYLLILFFAVMSFAAKAQIQELAELTTAPGGKYAIVIDSLIRGGVHTGVSDTVKRNQIDSLKRRVGMWVITLNNAGSDGVETVWQLQSTPLANNGSNWLKIFQVVSGVITFNGFANSKIAYVDSLGNDATAAMGRPDKPYKTINSAADVLINGGVVMIGLGTFGSPDSLHIHANTKFIGSGKPQPNWGISVDVLGNIGHTKPTALTGGTILQGTLTWPIKNGIEVKNLGIDVGYAWTTAHNGGLPADGLVMAQVITHPPQAAKPPVFGYIVENVAVLGRSDTATNHAILCENTYAPKILNCSTYYNEYGFVMKSIGGEISNCDAYGHSFAAYYFKADPYAFSEQINAVNLFASNINGNDGGGIAIQGENQFYNYLNLTNFQISHTTYGIWVLGGADGVKISHGSIISPSIPSDNSAITGIAGVGIILTDTYNTSISDVQIRNPSNIGIYARGTTNITTANVLSNIMVANAGIEAFDLSMVANRMQCDGLSALNCPISYTLGSNIFGTNNTSNNGTYTGYFHHEISNPSDTIATFNTANNIGKSAHTLNDFAPIAGVTGGWLIGGTTSLNGGVQFLNKTSSGYLPLLTRNTSGSEALMDLGNIHDLIVGNNIYSLSNFLLLNKSASGYLPLFTRDITGSEARMNITNIGSAVLQSTLEVDSTIVHRSNIGILNKARSSYLTWVTRNTSGSEVKVDLSNIGNVNAQTITLPGTTSQIVSGNGSLVSPYISALTTTGNSGSSGVSSGVLNIPTYTLSGLGGAPINNPVFTTKSSTVMADAGTSFTNWNNYATFGINASSSTGANLGLGYDATDGIAQVVALQPGVAWKALGLYASQVNFTIGGIEKMLLNTSGNLDLEGNKIINLPAGSASTDAVNLSQLIASAGTIIGTPTIVAGAGAGTSPTINVASNGHTLAVLLTAGTSPNINATIATITLPTSLGYTPSPVISGNDNLSASIVGVYAVGDSSTSIRISISATALTAGSTYLWSIKL